MGIFTRFNKWLWQGSDHSHWRDYVESVEEFYDFNNADVLKSDYVMHFFTKEEKTKAFKSAERYAMDRQNLFDRTEFSVFHKKMKQMGMLPKIFEYSEWCVTSTEQSDEVLHKIRTESLATLQRFNAFCRDCDVREINKETYTDEVIIQFIKNLDFIIDQKRGTER